MAFKRRRVFKKKRSFRRFKKRSFSKKKRGVSVKKRDAENLIVICGTLPCPPAGGLGPGTFGNFSANTAGYFYESDVYTPQYIFNQICSYDVRAANMYTQYEFAALGKTTWTRHYFKNPAAEDYSNVWGYHAIDPAYGGSAPTETQVAEYPGSRRFENGQTVHMNMDIQKACKERAVPFWQATSLGVGNMYVSALSGENLPALVSYANFQNGGPIVAPNANARIFDETFHYRIMFKRLKRVF